MQVVTVSFFRFSGFSRRWWALQQMGLSPGILPEIPGLTFGKMLGSGAGNGFSIRPNFGVYGLLQVWDSEAAARDFFQHHAWAAAFGQQASEYWRLWMYTARVHGEWEGQSPFVVSTPFQEERPVAVLTRATIRRRHLWRFWRFVPSVSRSLGLDQEGLQFAVGVGELPLIQQATFSLWRDSKHMQAYAYHGARHRGVIRKTRELGWYREEMFARFHPFASEGTWDGVDPWAAISKEPAESAGRP